MEARRKSGKKKMEEEEKKKKEPLPPPLEAKPKRAPKGGMKPPGAKGKGEEDDDVLKGGRSSSSLMMRGEKEKEEKETTLVSTRKGETALVAVQAEPSTRARKKSSTNSRKKKEEEGKEKKEKKRPDAPPQSKKGGCVPRSRVPRAPGASPAQQGQGPPPGAPCREGPRRRKKGRPSPSPSPSSPQAQEEAQPLRQVLLRLKLAKERSSEAARQVNLLRDRLLKALRKAPCFRDIEVLGAGSYYEKVKICRPNEFDIMLKVPKVRVELEPCEAVASSGAFYYVKLKRDCAKKELKEFCDDDERLSSSNMLLKLRNIIIEEVKKIKDMNVSVEKKKPGCPAVTLLIGSSSSVISVDIILGLEFYHSKGFAGTWNSLGIEEWLGTKVKRSLRFEPLYLVPKNVKDGQHFIDTWRLSFSKIEKIILHNHGQTKTCCEIKGVRCCRKDCLKLLKYLLEQLKTKHEDRNQFDKFCSYQVKTAFFHACVMWPKDDDWLPANLDECFTRLLNYFLSCLREAKLPHFFIRTFNFFCEEKIEKTKRNALIRAIEREVNNRYPSFFNLE